MIQYILLGLGVLFAITGVVLFVKRQTEDGSNKIRFLGIELETKSSSLVIFAVGAGLLVFAASLRDPVIQTTDTVPEVLPIVDSPKNPEPNPTTNNELKPLYEFTLTAGQQHVIEGLQITLTLLNKPYSPISKAVTIRLWREVRNPISDTAILDPQAANPGETFQLMVVNTITPVMITDVGQFRFYVSNPVVHNRRIASVQVKMYNNAAQ